MLYEVAVKGLNKVNNLLGGLTKSTNQLKSLNKGTKEYTESLEAQEKANKSLNNAADDYIDKLTDATGTSGINRTINKFKEMRNAFKKSGQSINKVIGMIAKRLLTILVPIALIAGAFLFLKQAFKVNAGGIASEWFKLMGGLKRAWGKFQSNLNKLLRGLGPLFKVAFAPIKVIITILTTIFEVFVGVIGLLSKIFGKWTTTILLVVGALFLLYTNPVFAILGAFVFLMAKFPKVMKVVTLAILVLVAATWAWNAALFANPITWIVLAVVALIAGIVLLVKKLKTMGDKGKKLGKILLLVFFPVLIPIVLIIKAIKFLKKKFDEMGDKGKKIAKIILYAFAPVILVIKGIMWAIQAVIKAWEKLPSWLGGPKKDKSAEGVKASNQNGGSKTTKNDYRNISVFTNRGIDKKSFDENGAVNSISG